MKKAVPDIRALLSTKELQEEATREDADATFDMLMYKCPVPIADASAMLGTTLLHFSNRVLTKAGPYQREYSLYDILRLSHAGSAQSTQPVLLTWDCVQSAAPTRESSIQADDIFRPDLLPVRLPLRSDHPSTAQPMHIDSSSSPRASDASDLHLSTPAAAATSAIPAAAVTAAPLTMAATPYAMAATPFAMAATPYAMGMAAAAVSPAPPPIFKTINPTLRKRLICDWLEQMTDSQRAQVGLLSPPLTRIDIVRCINREAPKSEVGQNLMNAHSVAWQNLLTGGFKDETAAMFIIEKYFKPLDGGAGALPFQYGWNADHANTHPEKKRKRAPES